MTTLEPGTQFGPYLIEGYVAGGGMGRVYAASHEVYGNAVALKVLHDRFAQDPRWHRRFSEEGLVGLQLKHPHVLSARELVEADGQLALAMDLVRGGQTLLSVIERERPSGLPITEALPIFLRILSGVEYLHDRGVVHGDLKPENVLIDGQLRDPSTWKPLVTDFGTVALIADPVTIDGQAAVVASPRYASPEHLKGSDHLEVRSDVHGLGLLLYWLISGEHSSNARTVEQAAESLAEALPLVHVVDQPEPLLNVLRTATATDPAERYADCRALALAIRGILDELGLGLQLEDLQSELATEILEEQAKAQKALQEGGPAPTADDTELSLEPAEDSDVVGPEATVETAPPPIGRAEDAAMVEPNPAPPPEGDEPFAEDAEDAPTAPTEVPPPQPPEFIDDAPTVDDSPTVEASAFQRALAADTPEPATSADQDQPAREGGRSVVPIIVGVVVLGGIAAAVLGFVFASG